MRAMASMERITVRLDEEDLDRLETRVERGQFPNVSEAVRAAVRLLDDEVEMPDGEESE